MNIGIKDLNKNVGKSQIIKTQISKNGIFILLIIAFVIFSLITKSFFTLSNIANIGFSLPIQGIIALTMTLIIISGNLDLSVGAIIAFSGVLTAIFIMDFNWSDIKAIAVVLIVGILIGLINGFLIAILRINSIIVTLGMLLTLRGFSYVLVGHGEGYSRMISRGLMGEETFSLFVFLGREKISWIPIPIIIMIVLFIIFWFLLNRTTFGRQIYAIGGSISAARFSGIRVSKYILIIFILSSVMSSLSGIIMASQLSGGLAGAGDGFELSIVSAVLLGGASLSGGKGSLIGTLGAVGFLVVLRNGFNIAHLGVAWFYILSGVVLIIAVLIDSLREKYQRN